MKLYRVFSLKVGRIYKIKSNVANTLGEGRYFITEPVCRKLDRKLYEVNVHFETDKLNLDRLIGEEEKVAMVSEYTEFVEVKS